MHHLEIVCTTPDECLRAQTAGATRIELCSALELGGVTPSAGLMEEAISATNLPVMVMIRPRSGDFVYTEPEVRAMLHDIATAQSKGAKGVVFGLLQSDGTINQATTRDLVDAAAWMETVFHRAFDQVPDPSLALEQLIALGITRVLTSGQAATALEGAARLKDLQAWANGRIQILPGGGVRAGNAKQIIDETGSNQLHLAAFRCEDPERQIRQVLHALTPHA